MAFKKTRRFRKRRPRINRRRRRRVTKINRSIGPSAVHAFKRVMNLGNQSIMGWSASSLNSGENVGNGSSDFTTFDTGNGGASNVTYYAFALSMTLASLPDYTEFTSLFDQYRILGVQVKFYVYQNMAPTDATAGNQSLGGLIHSIIDHDDVTIPNPNESGINLLREYSTYKCGPLLKTNYIPLKRFFKPRIAVAAYAGSLFNGYANVGNKMWIDTASTGVQYYGMKGVVQIMSPISGSHMYIWIKPQATVYLQCRDVK